MADRIYCGNGKIKSFPGGGSIIEITVSVDDLFNNLDKYGFVTKGGKRMIRLKCGSRREPDQYGNTHSLEIDTFKPDPNRASSGASQPSKPAAKSVESDGFQDDIPF